MILRHDPQLFKGYIMVRNFWNKIVKSQEQRAAYYMLQNLSDRQLSDIGVTRSEIKYRVYK